jgi:hypothetical protein
MPCAVFVWEVVLRDGLVWSDVPKSMWDFKENFIVSRGSWGVGLVWFLFGVVCWTPWLNQNDFIFNNKIISSLQALIFRLISLIMQHWMVTCTGADRFALERMVEGIKSKCLRSVG